MVFRFADPSKDSVLKRVQKLRGESYPRHHSRPILSLTLTLVMDQAIDRPDLKSTRLYLIVSIKQSHLYITVFRVDSYQYTIHLPITLPSTRHHQYVDSGFVYLESANRKWGLQLGSTSEFHRLQQMVPYERSISEAILDGASGQRSAI